MGNVDVIMTAEKRMLGLSLSSFFMPSLTKNQKIEALVKLVQKRSRGAGLTAPPQRTVLETLIYAALLENATFDKADLAYTVLENSYVDWNEIRVCTVRELADTLTNLPHPEAAADRVRQALQGIFEKTYMFDLEEMRKKGKALAEHIKSLESMSAGTPYMIQYAAQVALDGHLIPFDEASLRIMRRLGLSHVSSDGTKEVCIGLDRVILKKSSLTFAAQLHHFAAGYYDVPDSPELLSQLSAIDPEAVKRNWTSPITASSSAKTTVPPASEVKPESPGTKPQASKNIPEAVSVTPPVKKSTKKSKEKVPPVKSVAASPKKPAVPAKKVPSKEPSSKVSKESPKKQKAPPKKPESKKPEKPVPPPKKPAAVKGAKSPAKPVEKPKVVQPSKALRKKKPK